MNLRKLLLMSSVAMIALPVVFDPNKGWKKDDDGNLALVDGNPVYIDGQGAELTVNETTISTLNGESKNHREAKEKAEARVKEFDGIDPAKAREALKTVANLDAGDLVKSADVEKLRTEITQEVTATFTEQMTTANETNKSLTSTNDSLKLDIAFSGSQFVKDRIAIPQDMFRKTFGDNFKTEDGNIVAYDSSGNKIYSQKNMGQLAGFDEAVEIIVGNYPSKDQILKDAAHSGSGNGGQGGQRGGGVHISRSDFDKLGPVQQAEIAMKGEITITD